MHFAEYPTFVLSKTPSLRLRLRIFRNHEKWILSSRCLVFVQRLSSICLALVLALSTVCSALIVGD